MSADTWKDVTLGDLISIKHGWPFKSQYFREGWSGGPIVVSIGNFRYTGGFRFASTSVKEYIGEYPQEYELEPGDILLVMTCQTEGGEILGVPARVPADGRTYLHNQRMGKVVLRRPDLASLDFLYWVFLWAEFNRELVASSSGTKIRHTAPKRIEAFRFSLPPLEQQRAIAEILGSLDGKIAINREMNGTLEAIAQGIFKSWFVDFDPVTARAEGRQPYSVDSGTAALFPDRFNESELGPVPISWTVRPIGELAPCVGGSTPSTREPLFWEGGNIPWSTPRNLAGSTNPIITKTARKISASGLQRISSGLLPKGTVLLSSRAPIGYTAIAETALAVNQGFIAIKPGGMLPSIYILYWLRENMESIMARANGTTFQEISKRNFRPIPALLPTRDILEQFESTTAPLFHQIASNIRQSMALTQLRDLLLPKLLSGEIRIPQTKKLVEEVA